MCVSFISEKIELNSSEGFKKDNNMPCYLPIKCLQTSLHWLMSINNETGQTGENVLSKS